MADFVIIAPVPFVVQGVDGREYELPRIKDLSAEQIAGIGALGEAEGDVVKVAQASRDFILSLCPDLAAEPLSDFAYTQLLAALAEGSGISLGES